MCMVTFPILSNIQNMKRKEQATDEYHACDDKPSTSKMLSWKIHKFFYGLLDFILLYAQNLDKLYARNF